MNLDTKSLMLPMGVWKLHELRVLVPPSYRDRLWVIIMRLYDAATKFWDVSSSHKELVAHKAAGTWPASLVAVAQKTDLHLDDGPFKTLHAAGIDTMLTALSQKHAGKLLDAMIQMKAQEMKYFLDGVLAPKNYEPLIGEALAQDLDAMLSFPGLNTQGDEHTREYPEWLLATHKWILIQAPNIASRAIEIARAPPSRVDLRTESKAKGPRGASVALADPKSPAVPWVPAPALGKRKAVQELRLTTDLNTKRPRINVARTPSPPPSGLQSQLHDQTNPYHRWRGGFSTAEWQYGESPIREADGWMAPELVAHYDARRAAQAKRNLVTRSGHGGSNTKNLDEMLALPEHTPGSEYDCDYESADEIELLRLVAVAESEGENMINLQEPITPTRPPPAGDAMDRARDGKQKQPILINIYNILIHEVRARYTQRKLIGRAGVHLNHERP